MKIDVVCNKLTYVDTVANFDLSCCQIYYDRKTKNVFVSDLFLYTYETGVIICMPENIIIDYYSGFETGDKPRITTKSLKTLYYGYISKDCISEGSQECKKIMKRHKDRIKKYIKRQIGCKRKILFKW